ncbi:unnamed protein product [Hapterophycus canaliculatus]
MHDAFSWSRWLSAHLDRAVRVGDGTLVEPLLQALCHSPQSIPYASNLVMSAASESDARGVTPVAAARWHRNRGDVRGRGALTDINNINTCNPVTGQQPLHVATHLGNRVAVRTLLVNGADVDGRAGPSAADGSSDNSGLCSFPLTLLRGMTALHWAALRGYWEIVEDLLSCGADLEARVAESGETALHLAARHKREAVVGVLLDAGADPLVLSRFNLTPMDLAAVSNDPGTLSEFLYRGVDPDSKNALGYTAVHQAAYSNSSANLQLLLECGGSVNSATGKGYTPLHVAAAFSTCTRPAAAAAAAAAGSTANSSKRGAQTSAVRTIARFSGDFLDVDAVDNTGSTPLRTACVRLREHAVRDLLEIGADEQLVGDLSLEDFVQNVQGGSKNGGGISGDLAAATSGADASGSRAESIARVRAMLASAPANRAWRRRGWLAILRTRANARRASAAHDGDSRNFDSTRTSARHSCSCGGGAGGGVVGRPSRKRSLCSCLGDGTEVVDRTPSCKARHACKGGGVAAGAAAAGGGAGSMLGSSEGGKDQGMATAVIALADEEVFRRIVLFL